jgi:DNA (cytosine-5)-methyltransferase 1
MELTHLSLFTGIGGIDLAAEWAGFTTVGQCEWKDFQTSVLAKHWPEVQRWRDIRTLNKENFNERTGLQTIDLISGGFPCQPFSVAGKRKGEDDDRYLWPEMLRVISELQPAWVLGENVAGIVNMALDQVLSGLENIGYETQTFIIPACGVNALHRRNRVFIVANSNGTGADKRTENRRSDRDIHGQDWQTKKKTPERNRLYGTWENGSLEYVADSASKRLPGSGESIKPMYSEKNRERKASKPFDVCIGEQWAAEPGVGRVANGIPDRVDRLTGLGNAVVPYQVYPILKYIAEIILGS